MDGPERDYVNFPRRQRPIEKPPVRLKMFPEEWFTALHSKTGVTGSLTARAAVTTLNCGRTFLAKFDNIFDNCLLVNNYNLEILESRAL